VAITVACARQEVRQEARVVSLPDISRAAPDVQAQLRERHAAMTRVVGQPSSPPADRAAAYGDMGKLFVATEFYEAAERCFASARQLAPGDMRWPYYLAQVARLGNDPAKAAGLFDGYWRQPDRAVAVAGEMRLAQSRPPRLPLLLKAQSLATRGGRPLRPGRVAPRSATRGRGEGAREAARPGAVRQPRTAGDGLSRPRQPQQRPRRTCACAARPTCRRPTA
jgi:hypothetical protein